MDLVKATRTTSDSVSITATGDSPALLKTVFELAEKLHAAGFAAVLNPVTKETGQYKWRVEIRTRTPHFLLTGQSGKANREAKDIAGVLRLLRGQDVG